MTLVSPNYPSAVGYNGAGLPHPGPQPVDGAVLVQLTCAMATTEPFAITGDQWQWLWLSPEAAEFAVTGKNAVYYRR